MNAAGCDTGFLIPNITLPLQYLIVGELSTTPEGVSVVTVWECDGMQDYFLRSVQLSHFYLYKIWFQNPWIKISPADFQLIAFSRQDFFWPEIFDRPHWLSLILVCKNYLQQESRSIL